MWGGRARHAETRGPSQGNAFGSHSCSRPSQVLPTTTELVAGGAAAAAAGFHGIPGLPALPGVGKGEKE